MYEQFQNIMKMGPFGQIMVSSLFEVDINGRECFICFIFIHNNLSIPNLELNL